MDYRPLGGGIAEGHNQKRSIYIVVAHGNHVVSIRLIYLTGEISYLLACIE